MLKQWNDWETGDKKQIIHEMTSNNAEEMKCLGECINVLTA